jgi:hypothetical protein
MAASAFLHPSRWIGKAKAMTRSKLRRSADDQVIDAARLDRVETVFAEAISRATTTGPAAPRTGRGTAANQIQQLKARKVVALISPVRIGLRQASRVRPTHAHDVRPRLGDATGDRERQS